MIRKEQANVNVTPELRTSKIKQLYSAILFPDRISFLLASLCPSRDCRTIIDWYCLFTPGSWWNNPGRWRHSRLRWPRGYAINSARSSMTLFLPVPQAPAPAARTPPSKPPCGRLRPPQNALADKPSQTSAPPGRTFPQIEFHKSTITRRSTV